MNLSAFYDTAPAQASERAMQCFALLDTLHIPYRRIEHDRADTMELCAAISDALEVRICKNLFLCNRQKTAFYLLTMPEDKPFVTRALSGQIGSSRLSFAPPEKMEELLHCAPGSASVLGLMHDTGRQVRLLIDREVAEAPYFACHPCDNTESLKIKTGDLLEKLLPYIGHSYELVTL